MNNDNDEQLNRVNRESETDNELGSRIIERHLGLAEKIEGRSRLPFSALSSAPIGIPVLARELSEKTLWNDAVVNRAGALAYRIQRSVQKTLFPTEPVEMAWFRKERLGDGGADYIEPGEEYESSPATQRVVAPEIGAPAMVGRKPSPGSAANFVSAHQARTQNPPIIAFSGPILESMGISSSETAIAEESAPMFFDDFQSARERGEIKPISSPMTLRRKPEVESAGIPAGLEPGVQGQPLQQEALSPESEPSKLPGESPQGNLYRKGLDAISTLASRIPFLPVRKTARPAESSDKFEVAASPVQETGEIEQVEKPTDTLRDNILQSSPEPGLGSSFTPARETRLMVPKVLFKGIIARKQFNPTAWSGPAEELPVESEELPLYKPEMSAGKPDQIDRAQAQSGPSIPSVPGLAAELGQTAPVTDTTDKDAAVPASPALAGPEMEAGSKERTPLEAGESLSKEIAEKYQAEGIIGSTSVEQPLPLARQPGSPRPNESEPEMEMDGPQIEGAGTTTNEEFQGEGISIQRKSSDEEAASMSGEEFAGMLTEKYQPTKMTTTPLSFVQRATGPESISEGMTVTGLASVLSAKYLPDKGDSFTSSSEISDEFTDTSSDVGMRGLPLMPYSGEGISREEAGDYFSGGIAGAPERILRKPKTVYTTGSSASPEMIHRKFERPEMVLAGSEGGVAGDMPSDHIYRSEGSQSFDDVSATEEFESEKGQNPEALAREVYSIIKRRLAVEKERAGYR